MKHSTLGVLPLCILALAARSASAVQDGDPRKVAPVTTLQVVSVSGGQATFGWYSPDRQSGTTGIRIEFLLRTVKVISEDLSTSQERVVAGPALPADPGTWQTHAVPYPVGSFESTATYFTAVVYAWYDDPDALFDEYLSRDSNQIRVDRLAADPIPPRAIAGLLMTEASTDRATLAFTAPGDDGIVGKVTSYEVRISTVAPPGIGELPTDFDVAGLEAWYGAATAATVSGPIVIASPQTTQTLQVTGLSPATTYHVAIRAFDEAGNGGAISNVASGATPGGGSGGEGETPVPTDSGGGGGGCGGGADPRAALPLALLLGTLPSRRKA